MLENDIGKILEGTLTSTADVRLKVMDLILIYIMLLSGY